MLLLHTYLKERVHTWACGNIERDSLVAPESLTVIHKEVVRHYATEPIPLRHGLQVCCTQQQYIFKGAWTVNAKHLPCKALAYGPAWTWQSEDHL